MTITPPAAGQDITDDFLSDLTAAAQPLFAYRTSDSAAIQSDATVNDDDTLFVTPTISAVYTVKALIMYRSDTTADFKLAFAFPAGASLYFSSENAQFLTSTALGASTQLENAASGSAYALGGNGTGTTMTFSGTGVLIMGTTAGDFKVQWAQNTSTATNTAVRAGSYIRLDRVA
jgi:hypothetical protein